MNFIYFLILNIQVIIMIIDIFFILNLSNFEILIEFNIFNDNFSSNNILISSNISFSDYIFDSINL